MAHIPVAFGAGGANDLDQVTAGAEHTLIGKIGCDAEGNAFEGTMPDRGTVSQALNAGGSYTIPAGYHNGSGRVAANSLSSQTSANAVAADIRSGKNAWVNGVKVDGSAQSLEGGTYKAKSTTQTIQCAGKYMTSNITIQATNVQSILSFSFASRNYHTANFKWQNPSIGPYQGIVVRGKQGSYPSSVTDGKQVYSGYGTNKNASGMSYSGYTDVGTGTWYFKAYSYYVLDGVNVYDSGKQATAQFSCYDCNQSNCGYGCTDGGYNCIDSSYQSCGCYGPGECPSNCDKGGCREGCDQGCNDYCSDCTKWYPSACIGNT